MTSQPPDDDAAPDARDASCAPGVSPAARALAGWFCRETAVTDLHGLPGG